MPRDLPDLLGDALPRDTGAPDLGAIESRVVRRRAGRLGGAALALAAAVAIGAQVLPTTPPTPLIDEVEDTAPAGTTVLPLPPPGEVAAAHANGRPVFVVHDDDGEVRVLDAISPHGSDPHLLKVLAYCTTSGWFVDPWHGSQFARNGAWAGGPAPYGLANHEVLRTTGDNVVVGGLLSAPTRDGRRATEPTGPNCGDTLSGVRVDDFLLHTATATALVPGLHYAEYPQGGGDSGLLLRDEPQVPLPGDDVTLPLPAPGEVSADHVNGRPVFVRNNGDGNVLVLDAVNPHVTAFGPKVLAWCRRLATTTGAPRLGGGPVDLWYGSHFTGDGVAFSIGGGGVPAGGWTGGPAPTGLGRLPVSTVTPGTVTVAGSPLPPPPRVGDDSIGAEDCSEAVALFPDSPPADPTVLDDLVLHEPLFGDDWWYPTPERILGEEPGLPPDELTRYLEATGIDPDEPGDLDLAKLPALGDVGLAVQRQDGVELVALDGSSHGLLRGSSLEADTSRDGHGGPVLLRTTGGRLLWLDPSDGATVAADDVTVLQGDQALVDGDGDRHEALTTYGAAQDGPTVLAGPLRVSNGHRLVSGPDCLMNAGASCQDGSRFIDTDIGGVGTSTPGCNPTDGLADVTLVSACWFEDDAWLEVDTPDAEGAVRIEVPRYPGQPDDQPRIGHFTDAVFGGPGVVAQLSLECEIPAVVGFGLDGTPVDLWGGRQWSDGPTSGLMGTAVLPGGEGPVPLVHVAATECGDTGDVPEGVWAITGGGPVQLNDITDPVALWTATTDLAAIGGISP